MSDTNITVTVEGSKVVTTTPYNPDFIAPAKGLGGRFLGKENGLGKWQFDSRDEQRVRDLLRTTYGTDGDAVETVTVRIDITKASDPEFRRFGRLIARRDERDADVRLGPGVVLVHGGFQGRGGSMKYPELGPLDGTILEVRDIPAGHPDLSDLGPRDEIVDTGIDPAGLAAERARLVARIAEIDALLS